MLLSNGINDDQNLIDRLNMLNRFATNRFDCYWINAITATLMKSLSIRVLIIPVKGIDSVGRYISHYSCVKILDYDTPFFSIINEDTNFNILLTRATDCFFIIFQLPLFSLLLLKVSLIYYRKWFIEIVTIMVNDLLCMVLLNDTLHFYHRLNQYNK